MCINVSTQSQLIPSLLFTSHQSFCGYTARQCHRHTHPQFRQFYGASHTHQSINCVWIARKNRIELNYRYLAGLQNNHYFSIRIRYLLDYLPIDQWLIWNNQKTEQHLILCWILPPTHTNTHTRTHHVCSHYIIDCLVRWSCCACVRFFLTGFSPMVFPCLIYFTNWCVLSSYLNTTTVRLDNWYSSNVRV